MAFMARSREEVVHLLKDSQGSKSLVEFADELGVSKQYLSNVFNGYDPPSDRLLEAFGYRRSPSAYVQIPKQEKVMPTATKVHCGFCPEEFDTEEGLIAHATKDHVDKLRRPATGTKQQTLVSVILDKSGSMSTKVQDVIGGFNTYIEELKKDTASEFKFTLTLFDTDFEEKYLGEPLDKVQPLDTKTYEPSGNTALNDAIGRTIRLIENDKPTGKVIVVIMTDGEENSSHEFSHQAVKQLIEARQKDGWAFIFLGASPDAWNQGMSYGITHSNVAHYDPTQYQGTYANVARATTSASAGLAPMTACFSANPDSMLRSANLQVADATSGVPPIAYSTPKPVSSHPVPQSRTPRSTSKNAKRWNKKK
jgi:uncharacterized protein YegL/transcriptional regulator with XRE-family HTH domain